MRSFLPWFGCALACWALPAAGAAENSRDGLAIQDARNRFNAGQRQKRFYSAQWDLSGLPAYAPIPGLHGTVRLRGNDAVTNGLLGQYWTERFRQLQPDITLDLDLKSSAVAMPALITDTADIAIGRHANFMELLGYERIHSSDPLEIVALNGAFDALGWSPAYVVVVNAQNPLTQISAEQLDGIYGAERNGGWIGTSWHPEFARGPEKNLRRWDQLGLTGSWRGQPIHPYAMNLQYNPSVDFDRMVMQGGGKWNEQLRQYSQYADAKGSLILGAKVLVQDIAKDPKGIGISCLAYLVPGTKVLAVAGPGGQPFLAPTLEHIQDRSYFLHGECYFYLNQTKGRPLDPATLAFVRFALSREGQAEVVRDGKYLPLPASTAHEQMQKLTEAPQS